MKTENMNRAYLDRILDGSQTDFYYHFGISSNEALLERLRGVRAIVIAGSGERIRDLARHWSILNHGADILEFPKEERFVTRYTSGILFASHGMGMPSASIAVQELMRMLYFLKNGDSESMDQVFWVRVGTSGGVGLPGGSVVVSTAGLMSDLRPYRLLRGGDGEYWFNGTFPALTCREIIAAGAENGQEVIPGKTVAGNDFFLEQFRLDGAICFETPEARAEWLKQLYNNGVRNIEMEGAMLAGYLNHWGFSSFAMICSTLLDRLQDDQVRSTPEELQVFSEKAETVLFNYLQSSLLEQRPFRTVSGDDKDVRMPGPASPDWERLRRAAVGALDSSYSPYSHYPVGAAGFTLDGRLVRGANVENASYGLTLCAECSMISHLCSTGGGRLAAVYCVNVQGKVLVPCGRCRQLLLEHGGPDMMIMTPQGVRTMADILPQPFTTENIKNY